MCDGERVVIEVGLKGLARLLAHRTDVRIEQRRQAGETPRASDLVRAVGSDEGRVHVALLVLARPVHALHIVHSAFGWQRSSVGVDAAVRHLPFKALDPVHCSTKHTHHSQPLRE